jgi:hypothetical protein
MSKPLAWFLEILGLILIISGWSGQNWVMLFIGVIVALFGAAGIRERLKNEKKKV